MKAYLLLGAAALILSACAKPAVQATTESASVSAAVAAPSIAGIPAGDYTTDPAHTSLTFELSHIGLFALHLTVRHGRSPPQARSGPSGSGLGDRHHRSAIPGA
ncbi:MAG: hypothetical protein WDN06_01450 [Asticcacaulis sp.]